MGDGKSKRSEYISTTMSSTVKIIFPFNLKKGFSFKGRKARFREEPLSSLQSLPSSPQFKGKVTCYKFREFEGNSFPKNQIINGSISALCANMLQIMIQIYVMINKMKYPTKPYFSNSVLIKNDQILL